MTWERSPNPGSETVGQICAVAPLQEEGRRGGAHTNAHSRAAPGRGTHPLRAGSGAFEGCHPVPSGSKSVGLSPTKVCALLELVGHLHGDSWLATVPLFKRCGYTFRQT